jgi:hypothetical protein
MTADGTTNQQAPLPEYAGITEPMTVLTNVILAIVAFALAARLGYAAAVDGKRAMFALAGAFMATAMAALFGAVAHGVDPVMDAGIRKRFWQLALYATGVVSAATVVCVAYFATGRGGLRDAILILAGAKLLAISSVVTYRPEFRLVVADNAVSLAALLAAALYVDARFSFPPAPWFIAGVVVSVVAGIIQAKRVGLHRNFNHNDVFHVVQMVALYVFFRGGLLLVDL